MYRSGIIGVGQAGYTFDFDKTRKFIWSHAKAYKFHKKTKLVAVSDIDTLDHRFNEDYPNVIFFKDYISMLEKSKLDIVSICTPTHTHLEIIKSISQQSSLKAIFLEKPVGQNLSEAVQIDKICKSNNIVLATNYMRRWDYSYNFVNGLIESQSLGKLETIIALGNTSLLTSASHLIDLMIFFGKEINWVVGDLQENYIRNVNGINDHGGTAMVKFDNDVCGFLKAVSKNETNLIFSFELFFEDGKVKISEPFIEDDQCVVEIMRFVPRTDNRYKALAKTEEKSLIKANERMLDAISDILKCAENGISPKSSGQNAIEVHKFIESMKRSFSTLKIVNYE